MQLNWPLWLWSAKRRFLKQQLQPNITRAEGSLKPGSSPYTFVMICGPDFDETVPNAGTTARLGWCHGFEQIGIPYVMVSIFDLARRLPELQIPLCWISESDYRYLDHKNIASLKKYQHMVWVNTWFSGEENFYIRHNLQNNSFPERTNLKVLSSEPSIVFTISPVCSFEFYSRWIAHGVQLVSLPLACDTMLYHPDAPFWPEFANVEMAFVGGYWPYKARQFDRYLKSYENQLTIYGYSSWPYANYGGQLPESKESSLYRQARLSPTINEPQIEVMGVDLNERVFKVLGSGGMSITDVSPAYREWFRPEELLVPENLSEYHDMVKQALSDMEFNRSYRQNGYRAVFERHTYAHRAQVTLKHFGVDAVQKS